MKQLPHLSDNILRGAAYGDLQEGVFLVRRHAVDADEETLLLGVPVTDV